MSAFIVVSGQGAKLWLILYLSKDR